MNKITIIDGYVDEPTCLGVPPYISPYPRYIYGSIKKNNHKNQILYLTIDQIRKKIPKTKILQQSDFIIVIAGMTVPGRYLSGHPASPREIKNILNPLEKSFKILTGPAAKHGFGTSGGKKTQKIKDTFDLIIKGDPETIIPEILKNNTVDTKQNRKSSKEIKKYAKLGAEIVKQHPNYQKNLIAEIETYRGCTRSITGGCSFCSEPLKGPPDYRPINDIVEEIQTLHNLGVIHFRIGNQPCLFSYMAHDSGKYEFPKPNTEAIKELFSKIRKNTPNLKTLHIDNANPGIISRYPKESQIIAKTIIKYHTPGDTAAFGVESTDPTVIKQNNLKANSEEIIQAIKIINKHGAKRGNNGMPELLPGLNFVFGLKGETKKTYEHNYLFLKKILEDNLLVRRINLRQIIPIPGTKMFKESTKILNKNKHHFYSFKNKIQKEIAQPMLKKILPPNTILHDVYSEKHEGKKLTFARQIGTYPLLVGIPGIIPLNHFYNVKITDYGYRSITAIIYPMDINNASRTSIEAIPGVGKKRAIRILAKRPFKNQQEFINAMDDPENAKQILSYIKI